MMGMGSSLGLLIDGPSPCPICDEYECTHEFYGKDHYRIGDPNTKHPIISRRYIPAPHRIISAAGQIIFQAGSLMTDDEAVKHGVAIPGQPGPPRKKGRRQRPADSSNPQG